MSARCGLPTLVVGGYLGTGKTSLVNHLLREACAAQPAQRIAVLVNDFGDLEIDAALITGQVGNVISLAGGCVCCSFGADLVGALQRMAAADPRPELILIETSGVALPAAVARTARLVQGLSLEGIVVLVDAQDVRARAADRYLHDTVRQQLADADLLLLNKTDLVTPEALAQTEVWLQATAPGTPVLQVQGGRLDPALLQSLGAGAQPRALAQTGWGQSMVSAPHAARQAFESRSFSQPEPVDVPALVEALGRQPGLLRAKGFVTDLAGQGHLLQMVGRHHSLQPWAPQSGLGLQLVLIGLQGSLSQGLPVLSRL